MHTNNAETDADRLADLWSSGDGSDGSKLEELQNKVALRAARYAARRLRAQVPQQDWHDIVAEAYLLFRKRADVLRARGEVARGGILLRVVEDAVRRYDSKRRHCMVCDGQPLDEAFELSGNAAVVDPREFSRRLVENRGQGLAGLNKLLRGGTPDEEVELFADLLLRATTDLDAMELDPVGAVRKELLSRQWTELRVRRTTERSMRRPEVKAMLTRFQALTSSL